MAPRELTRRLGVLILATSIAACAAGESAPVDDALFRHDLVLIRQLWADFSASWEGGVGAGYAFIAKHDHPALGCSVTDFDSQLAGVPESLQWTVTVEEGSVARHDTWRIRDALSRSFVPDGRIYRHAMQSTFTGDFPTETREWESHVAILDDEAVFFFPCR